MYLLKFLFNFLMIAKIVINQHRSHKEDIDRELQTEFRTLVSSVLYKCLESSNKTEKFIRQLTDEQKLELFRKSNCPPVILIPGFIASKLEFVMKNCTEFSRNHKAIMETCGWKNCKAKELQSFTVWINVDIDMGAIFGMDEGQKKEYIPKLIRYGQLGDFKVDFPQKKACFGHLMRNYFEKNHNNLIETVKLKGAELTVKIVSKKDCGAGSISNYAGPLSNARTYQGFNSMITLFNKMGYQNVITLFPYPYDFRSTLKEASIKLKNTIDIAYKINKKKLLIIGHSLGGLVSYKYTLNAPALVERIISIGSPFLGSRLSISSFLSDFNPINQKQHIDFSGMKALVKTKIDKSSNQLFSLTCKSIIDMLPRRVIRKSQPKDKVDEIIYEIHNIEIQVKEFLSKNKGNSSIEEFFQNLVTSSSNNILIEHFFTIFKKPFEQCKLPVKTNSYWSDSCKINSMDHFLNHTIIVNNKTYSINNLQDLMGLYINESHLDYKLLDHKDIDRFEYINHLFENAETETFSFKNPGIPFMFVFSSHLPTVGNFEINRKKIIKQTHVPGDSTIDTFSQIYPALRWIFENKMNKVDNPIHLIEYCASSSNEYFLNLINIVKL